MKQGEHTQIPFCFQSNPLPLTPSSFLWENKLCLMKDSETYSGDDCQDHFCLKVSTVRTFRVVRDPLDVTSETPKYTEVVLVVDLRRTP